MGARSHAGFTDSIKASIALDLDTFFFISARSRLEKRGLVVIELPDRDKSGLLLRALAMGKRQQLSESIGVVLDTEYCKKI